MAQGRYYGGIAVHLFCPVGGFGDLTLLDLDKGEGNRKENAYQDLVALPSMVGWSIPVRWALVVAGWMVTVMSGLLSFVLLRRGLPDSRVRQFKHLRQ